ncbi:MAG TPA: hypothetical protein VLA79_21435 [Polyangia bacterium]|nr:hypothetical protein [Polyangia bacterium]
MKRSKVVAMVIAPGPERWRRALLASLPALAFLLGCFPLADFDVWWHLRTGQLIVDTHTVPRFDLFTYTNATRSWIDVYWLYQVGLALLYRAGGASALVLLKATAGAGIVALSMLGRRPGHRAWPWALAWLPGVLMVSGRLSERPEAASLLLLTAYLVLLARAARAPRGLWLVPILQAVWVNCHGFFVLGPLVLLAYGAEWVLERLRPADRRADRPPARTFVAIVLLSLLACLVSPYGVKALSLPFEQFHTFGDAALYRAAIGELKTAGDFIAVAGIWNPYLLAYFATVLLGLVSFVLCARRAEVRLFRVLIFAAGVYLAWQATRNAALCGVIAALVTTWNFDDALAARPLADPAPTKKSRRRGPAGKVTQDSKTSTDAKTSRARRWPEPNAVLLVAVGALGLATVSGALYSWSGEGRRVGLGERPRWFAHDACAFLARADLPERVAAYNISQAAVCIAHGAPQHKQFMDPRLEVNTSETFERYLAAIRRLWNNDISWESALGIDYGRPDEIPALLIERGPLGRAAEILSHDSRWRCVFADQLATVFVTTRFAEEHHLAPVPLD